MVFPAPQYPLRSSCTAAVKHQFSRQRGLPERLNYYTNGFIFFGNTGTYGSKGQQRRAVRDMVKRPSTNQLRVQRKRF